MTRYDDLQPTSIVGQSTVILEAIATARRSAPSGLAVLLIGGTGTGKELFAQEIHRWSGCRGELVDVNCAGLPRDIAESLLFGHRKGAFTGAHEATPGFIENARDGTLFLDELGSLPREVQGKLLRVLDTGQVQRLGETTKRAVRFRVIAAAQNDLHDLVERCQFRLDLYQRLAGFPIRIPPLAARGEDVLLLAEWFARLRGRFISAEANRLLLRYSWPGNVRELKNVVDRACVHCCDSVLGPDVLADAIDQGMVAPPSRGVRPNGRDEIAAIPASELTALCQVHQWEAYRIAEALGVGRTKLFSLLRGAGISLRRGRSAVRIPPSVDAVAQNGAFAFVHARSRPNPN